jgi:hypothetical protein
MIEERIPVYYQLDDPEAIFSLAAQMGSAGAGGASSGGIAGRSQQIGFNTNFF